MKRISSKQNFGLVLLAGAALLIGGPEYSVAQKTTPEANQTKGAVLTGEAARGDWTTDAPGVRRHLTPADMDKPYQTKSVVNEAKIVPRPENAWPQAPAGFKVTEFAKDLRPRVIVTAPNGDLFVAESRINRIRVLRDADGDGKPEINELFADDLSQPFGIAFYPPGSEPTHVYIANTDAVVRFAYKNGDVKASGAPEIIVPDIPGGGRLFGGGHWTRDIVFSRDGKKMFVSVGSRSNADDDEREERRARILEFNPDGSGERTYAWGIRNAVGIASHPQTGDLWASVNERDALGDHLVPDYITTVKEDGFYGWPWYYIGGHQDPRHEGKRPELKAQVIVPDVLLQSHSASLAMTFYTGQQFPQEYWNDGFAAQHGSWNRSRRTGYKVIRVPLKDGQPTGEYEDFLTGFISGDGEVWGRPVGVTVGRDGALYVSDNGSNTVWRVAYVGEG